MYVVILHENSICESRFQFANVNVAILKCSELCQAARPAISTLPNAFQLAIVDPVGIILSPVPEPWYW